MASQERVRILKTRAIVENDGVKHVNTYEAAGTFRQSGIDNGFDLEEFKKEFEIRVSSYDTTSKTGEFELVFDMIGVDAPIANTLRRILLAEVPTVAIDTINLLNNTSIVQDEVLAHRMGLIPINVDPRLFEYKAADDLENEKNVLKFTLEVTCQKKKNAPKDGAPEMMYDHATVLSSQLNWVPLNDAQAALFADNPPRPVHADIPIAKLRPGQTIELEAVCVKGISRTHAKWSPVSTAFYRLMPEQVLKVDVRGEDAQELVKMCPMNVFDIEDDRAVVARPRDCTMCRECIRQPPWDQRVELRRVKNHFIFSIESTGILPPPVLFKEAVNVMADRCRSYLAFLDNMEE